MAGYDDDLDDAAAPGWGERLSRLAGLAGALVSVALIGGLAIWGYRLAVRDVTGVPVIRALEGPMRVAPEDPGGQTASYQGLAVNRVAAEGEAAPPPDRLVLAPRPTNLADEDLTVAGLTAPRVTARPPEEMSEAEAVAADDAVEAGAVEAAVEEALEAPVDLASAAPIGAPARLSPELRPMPRPARVSRAAAAAAAPATLTPASVSTAATAAPEEIDPDRLKSDARLVQLGAFDDAETARKEWQRLAARFGTYLGGKSRVIQQAQSGGRTFYRLRAAGFADDADARRFCAALLAEQAACIPVPR